MKKDVDNRHPLGYDVSTIDDQTDIEEKYEQLLSEDSVDRFMEELFGKEKRNKKLDSF